MCEFETDFSGMWKLWMPTGDAKMGLSLSDKDGNHQKKGKIISHHIPI